MARLITLLLLLAPCVTLNAQDYSYVHKVDKHLTIVGKDDLSGVIYNGKLVLPLEYNEVEDYDGYLLLRKNNLVGLASLRGEILLPVVYESIEDNYNGLLTLYNNPEFGVATYDGKMILPMAQQEVSFYGNSILVSQFEQQGIVDFNGNIIVPLRTGVISPLDEYGEELLVEGPDGPYLFLTENTILLDGYLPVTDRLFVKETEVSIRDYFAFLSDMKYGGDLEESVYYGLFPDTNQVEPKLLPVYRKLFTQVKMNPPKQKIAYDLKANYKKEQSVNMYLKPGKADKVLLEFPVTGISHDQALAYTQWLTRIYPYNRFTPPGAQHIFRLPAEEEWETIAQSGLADAPPYGQCRDSVNAEGCMLFIYKDLPHCSDYEEYVKYSLGGGSLKVHSMNPDHNGMLQLFGNVAEMVQEPGIAKGGSFYHVAKDACTNAEQSYTRPQPWLGFRVVAEVVFR